MHPVVFNHLFQEEIYHFPNPVAVILSKDWDAYTADEHLLLKKILSSVKLDFNAVQILTQTTIDLNALKIYSPSRVLIFGSDTQTDIPLYQETPAQGFTVIRADDLTALDDQKKKNLWIALRQMFGI